MNILHVNSNYLTSKLHENLIDKTESEKIHNTIFMPIKKETQSAFLYESKHEVYSPITFKDRDKYIFTYKQNKIYKKLKKTVNPLKFDMVQAHTLFTDGNIAYKLYKEFNIPYMVTVRGYTDINSFFKLRVNLRNIGRKILKNAKKIVFLSESNKNELIEHYIKGDQLKENILSKSVVLPNGIDDFWFENEGVQKSLNIGRPLRVIYVGKTMKLKNTLGTVRALNYLKTEKGVDITFTSIGKVLEESYAQQIREEVKVEYNEVDAIPREKLIDYYRNNDLFVMPSFSETFGLVYPEAMSQGLPVIYTKNQGFDGQFEEGAIGYAVDADNPKDIANKILKLLKNYEDLSKNALEGYKRFNWDHISKHYLAIYDEVVSKK